MALTVLSRRAVDHLDRFAEFLLETSPTEAPEVGRVILRALSILESHPLIGRRHANGLRELVISRGKHGYIALYRFDEAREVVRVLALRHQREAGYVEE